VGGFFGGGIGALIGVAVAGVVGIVAVEIAMRR